MKKRGNVSDVLLKVPWNTENPNSTYKYDSEGFLIEKKQNNGVWKYYWTAGGMLKAVQRPDGSVITFKYDAFGRRISKKYLRREFLYIWDKNVPLHEIQKEELCEDNIITWIFEGFTPTAKLINGKAYSIISDHIGTPILAIDTNGVKVWERELDIYGKVRKEFTHDSVKDRRSGFIPFLYAGQYYDKETELAYNRFRYYSPDIGAYISQDPIGLAGGNPTIYGYVFDSNIEIDPLGLDCKKSLQKEKEVPSFHRNNFLEKFIKMRQLDGDEIVYKFHGKKNRLGRDFNYVTNKLYTSEAELRKDLAILEEWGVKIEYVTTFKPQAGTWIGEGIAAPQTSSNGLENLSGGGYQGIIDVKNLPKSTIIKTIKIKF